MTGATVEGAEGALIGVELGDGAADPDALTEAVDAAQIERCRRALVARIPAMAGTPMRGAWAGLIMISPDGRPILESSAAVRGLILHRRRQRHLVQDEPGDRAGDGRVDRLGEPRLVDLAPFSAARFAAPRPWLHEHRYGAEEDTATISR